MAERIVGDEPDNAEWSKKLCVSLVEYSDTIQLIDTEDHMSTSALYKEAKSIVERFIDKDCDAEWHGLLQWVNGSIYLSCMMQGASAMLQGDPSHGLSFFNEARELAGRIAAKDPDNAGWQKNLARALWSLGMIAKDQGDLVEAAQFVIGTLEITKRFNEGDEISSFIPLDYHSTCVELSDLLSDCSSQGSDAIEHGDLERAASLYTSATSIAKHLAAIDADNADWSKKVHYSLNDLGDLAELQGKLQEAYALKAEAKTICEKLSAAVPHKSEEEDDLAFSIESLAAIAAKQGNLTEALCLLDQSKLIREKLVASAPLHYSRQRAFALLLKLQGELTLEKGDRDKALHFFAHSRSIWEHLVSSRPTDIARQGNLSIALDRLGLLAKLRGDVTEASGLRNLSQKYYQAVMVGAVDAQAELVEPLIELGQIAEKQGEFAEAIRFFTQSKAICERVVASDPTEIWARKKLTESHCYITKLA